MLVAWWLVSALDKLFLSAECYTGCEKWTHLAGNLIQPQVHLSKVKHWNAFHIWIRLCFEWLSDYYKKSQAINDFQEVCFGKGWVLQFWQAWLVPYFGRRRIPKRKNVVYSRVDGVAVGFLVEELLSSSRRGLTDMLHNVGQRKFWQVGLMDRRRMPLGLPHTCNQLVRPHLQNSRTWPPEPFNQMDVAFHEVFRFSNCQHWIKR